MYQLFTFFLFPPFGSTSPVLRPFRNFNCRRDVKNLRREKRIELRNQYEKSLAGEKESEKMKE